jgi:hypothetical protein
MKQIHDDYAPHSIGVHCTLDEHGNANLISASFGEAHCLFCTFP